MIVTCPACSVRYLVDPRAIGAKGRTVRCARCGHTWPQAAPEDAVLAAAAPVTVEPPPVSPRRGRAPVLTSEQRIQLPAIARTRRNWRMPLAAAAVVVLAVTGLGVGAVVARNRIVGLWPATAPLYARAGLSVREAAGSGLAFRKVTTSRGMENGLPSLVIDGEVANVSAVARPVPKLVAVLRDRDEHELQNWTFAVPTEQLLPGESVPFHTSIAQPPEAAAGVVVTFAGGGG